MATTNTWDQVVEKIAGVVNQGVFSKTFSPTTSQQSASGQAGYYSSVNTVCNAVSLSGNAGTGQVLSGYTFYSNSLTRQSGTMANRGNLNWSGSNTTYSVPAGYYSGGTLDSRPSYNNGYNAGNSAGRSLKSRTYSAPETTSNYTWKNTGNGNDLYGHIQISLGLGTHTIVGAHWYNASYSDSWILTYNGYMMRQNKKTFTRQDTGPTGDSWRTNNVLHLPSGGGGAHTIIVWYV